ncbi:hypothetical protein, partial [Shewanella sp.]
LGDAFPTLMDMNINQARVNTLTSLFHRFRLCVLGDDTPAIVDGLTGEKGDAIANALINAFAAKQGLPHPTASQNMADEMAKDDAPILDDMGDEQALEEDIGPDNSESDEPETELATEISQPISAVKFSNMPLNDCIQKQTKLFTIQQSQELSLLNCQFNPTDIVTLQDLSAFNNLDTLSLKGGTLSTLGNLNSNNLKTLMLTDMKVTDFSGKNIKLDSLFLSRISSNNWPSLIELNVQTISIDKTVNCAELKTLLASKKLIPIHPGLSPTEMAERMQQAETNGIPLLMLECAI